MTNLLLKPMVLAAPRAIQSMPPYQKKPSIHASQASQCFQQNQRPPKPPEPPSHQTTTIHLPRGNLALTYQTNSDYQLDDLLGFAQRINPKRAFLFVSQVLGRHIPVAPSTMRQAFTQLANLVPNHLPQPIVVVGMAETAVGLSAGVHQALQSRYPQALLLNSTRHAQPDATLLTTFSEDHSHASTHLIYQSDDAEIQQQLATSKTLIMVDDEASTGNTCVNVVSALRDAGLEHLEQVHLTTLVDWSLGQSAKMVNAADTADDSISGRLQGIHFQRHHLLAGAWQWTDAPNPAPISMPSVDTTEAGSQPILATGNWGRQPTLDSTKGFAAYLAQFQKLYCSKFSLTQWQEAPLPPRILVLGSNEFVWLPFLLAQWLEEKGLENKRLESKRLESKGLDTQAIDADTHRVIQFSALTRSPIALGGAIQTRLSFNDNYGLGMTNFAYNVEPNDWDLIVLCIETPSASVDSLWQDLDNVLVVSPE